MPIHCDTTRVRAFPLLLASCPYLGCAFRVSATTHAAITEAILEHAMACHPPTEADTR